MKIIYMHSSPVLSPSFLTAVRTQYPSNNVSSTCDAVGAKCSLTRFTHDLTKQKYTTTVVLVLPLSRAFKDCMIFQHQHCEKDIL